MKYWHPMVVFREAVHSNPVPEYHLHTLLFIPGVPSGLPCMTDALFSCSLLYGVLSFKPV